MDERARPLDEADVDADPLVQFHRWYREAAERLARADAVALGTATADGRPSVRMVLLKRADERGFVFFTSYASRKGRDLAQNARAALLFYWDGLGRQVRIEGRVERVPEAESDAYFDTRPLESRLSNIVSPQSEVVGSRADLEERREAIRGTATGRPETWGGYVVVPETYEFWQHRENRLHDRLRYRRDGSVWVVERLAP